MKGEDMAYLIPLMLLVLTAVGCAQPARYIVTEQDWEAAMAALDCPAREARQSDGFQSAAVAPAPLQPGEMRCIKVSAENPAAGSGVEIIQGRSYQFAMTPLTVWYDRQVAADPINGWGENLSLWLRFIRWISIKKARSPGYDLMVLLGEVRGQPPVLFAFKDYVEQMDTKASKASGTFIAPLSGKLTLFANDVKDYYENNSGYLVLKLQLANP
jgi:hypothetical protein